MAGEHALAEPKLKVTPECIPTPPNQCPYQVSTFYILQNPRNGLDKILKCMVTMTRSKLKSRMQHYVLHLQPLSNVPAKHQPPTLNGFRDIAQIKFYRSRSLQKGQIKVTP